MELARSLLVSCETEEEREMGWFFVFSVWSHEGGALVFSRQHVFVYSIEVQEFGTGTTFGTN